MQTVMVALALLGLCVAAEAKVRTEAVEYESGGVALEGYLAYDDAIQGKRPGVLVVHEWWGLNDYPKQRARQLAEMGYVAFAADMYGKGVVTDDMTKAGQLAGQFRQNWDTTGRALMRERAQAGLAVLAKNPRVDPRQIAAIGFCFGGSTVLELAYSGADIAGVVTFHGGLTVPTDDDLPGIKARFLILHGADDPSIKPETITAMQAALDQGHADWQMILYGGAVHKAVHYDEKAARRSWEAMKVFFNDIFGKR
jgi:dienelactone hydrolase